MWQVPYVPDMTKNGRDQKGYAELPFTPAGLKDWQSYDPANGDYTGSCLPYGLNRSINAPYPMEIMQTDKTVVLLFELNNWFHVVSVDGREHAKDLNATWFGDSVGRWDGDTLVIDTIGFNGYTRLDTIGHPHSDALHLVLRFRRTDAAHINYTVTVDDPKVYTEPWTNERIFTLMKGGLIDKRMRREQQGPARRSHQSLDSALGEKAREAGMKNLVLEDTVISAGQHTKRPGAIGKKTGQRITQSGFNKAWRKVTPRRDDRSERSPPPPPECTRRATWKKDLHFAVSRCGRSVRAVRRTRGGEEKWLSLTLS